MFCKQLQSAVEGYFNFDRKKTGPGYELSAIRTIGR